MGIGGKNRKKLPDKSGSAQTADEIIVNAEAFDTDSPGAEQGRVIMEPPKKIKFKLILVLCLISVAVVAVLAAVIMGGPTEVKALIKSPAVIGDTVFYHVNENTAGNGKLVRKNFVTGEEMASCRYDSLGGYMVYKNKVYFIDSNTLYRTDFSFRNPEKIVSGVQTAVLCGNDIYYISSQNKNQLRKCGANGKKDTQLTLVSAPEGETANFITVFDGELYVKFGDVFVARLGTDASYQETVLENTDISSISQYRDRLYIFTGTGAAVIKDKTMSEYSLASEYAITDKNSVYYLFSPDGSSLELYRAASDLKKRELIFTFPDTPTVSVRALSVDRHYIFIGVDFTRDSGRRSVLYLIDTKESQATELYSIGYYAVAE